ncbi:unnamed protein product [Sympodiomycopsis kandeliae]
MEEKIPQDKQQEKSFALQFPDPPLISDFSSAEWEGWFRDLPLGQNASQSQASTSLHTLDKQASVNVANGHYLSSQFTPGSASATESSQHTPASSVPSSHWTPASINSTPKTAGLTSMNGSLPVAMSNGSHATAPLPDVDQESMLKAIFGSDPCFSFPHGQASRNDPGAGQYVNGNGSSHASTSHIPLLSPPGLGDLASAAAVSSSTTTTPHLSIEARLSYLSLDFSAALDQCDPSRSTLSSDEAIRSRAESKLMDLFARADQVWCEMDRVGSDRMKKMYKVIEECDRNHNDDKTLAARHSSSLQGPFTSAGAMLALSLSFQMLDALRLLVKVINNKHTTTNFMSTFQQNSAPLPSHLEIPILQTLVKHYLDRLITKLENVINYARIWHHLGENLGPGPHDSCAVQIQGAKVKNDLQELKKSTDF